MKQSPLKSRALRFVLLIGVMSFFADFTYEGSRSILGRIWLCWEQVRWL